MSVEVCGEKKTESVSEKLLGMTVNNRGTWRHHFHGDEENMGLFKQLSRRLGMLKQVRKHVSNQKRFRSLLNGIFTSKLIYGITVWGSLWNLQGNYDLENRKSISTTKEDMRRLQTLQNSALRILTRKPYDTPTVSLLQASSQLSVHQLVAYHSAVQVYKIKETQQPKYHYTRLFNSRPSTSTRTAQNQDIRIDFHLSLSRGSFFFQSSRVWNSIPQHLKYSTNLETFKKETKTWTKMNITVRP